ncbi:DnaD domain protein [Marinococcus halophilus]|uniref:DnaD domain protein n=1 Tax=Marinococcus halophilus TaxID=1371 RepID=UPI0009A86946|nr:DnaD domain protein [Marinococcus halophilus]
MSFIRTVKREHPFAQIDKYLINDSTIDFKAKGILTYILSKPDGWKVRMNDLVNHTKEGERSVRNGMKLLEDVGYIRKYPIKGEQGKIQEWVYEVYERPEFNPEFHNDKNPLVQNSQVDGMQGSENEGSDVSPLVQNADVQNVHVQNSHYSNNDLSNKDSTNNELNNSSSNNAVSLSSERNPFEKYQECYGKFPNTQINNHIRYFEQQGMEDQMICFAIEKAASNGSGFNYVLGILNNWKDKGLYTYEQALNERKRREESKHGEHRESQDSGTQWIDTSLRNEL